jgi:hypothetical protein
MPLDIPQIGIGCFAVKPIFEHAENNKIANGNNGVRVFPWRCSKNRSRR